MTHAHVCLLLSTQLKRRKRRRRNEESANRHSAPLLLDGRLGSQLHVRCIDVPRATAIELQQCPVVEWPQ